MTMEERRSMRCGGGVGVVLESGKRSSARFWRCSVRILGLLGLDVGVFFVGLLSCLRNILGYMFISGNSGNSGTVTRNPNLPNKIRVSETATRCSDRVFGFGLGFFGFELQVSGFMPSLRFDSDPR